MVISVFASSSFLSFWFSTAFYPFIEKSLFSSLTFLLRNTNINKNNTGWDLYSLLLLWGISGFLWVGS